MSEILSQCIFVQVEYSRRARRSNTKALVILDGLYKKRKHLRVKKSRHSQSPTTQLF
jgi:hypothetical protein